MKRLIVVVLLLTASPVIAQEKEPAPREMQGAWAEQGRCTKTPNRFEIGAYRAGYEDRAQLAVHYDPARGAVVWDDASKADTFVLAPGGKLLVHLTDGTMRGPRERLVKCPGKLIGRRR
jgi:hypothetical protein